MQIYFSQKSAATVNAKSSAKLKPIAEDLDVDEDNSKNISLLVLYGLLVQTYLPSSSLSSSVLD